MRKKLKNILGMVGILLLFVIIMRIANFYPIYQWEKENPAPGTSEIRIDRDSGTTVFLIHSLGGTPEEFRDIAQLFAQKGYSVFVPLLPGHGTSPRDLEYIKYQNWTEFIDKTMQTLNTTHIIIGGASTGSMLALYFAQEYEFKGVIVLNTPYELNSPYAGFIPVIKLLTPYSNIHSEELKEIKEQRAGYESLPYNSIQQLIKLKKQVDLSKINEPILVMQSEKDEIVKRESALEIFDRVNSSRKYLIFLENSTHSIIDKKATARATETIIDFIGELG